MTITKTKPVDILTTARSKIAGWQERNQLLEGIGGRRGPFGVQVTATLTRPAAWAALGDQVEALILAGKPIPDDIAAPVVAAERFDQLAQVRAAALTDIASKYPAADTLITAETVEPAFRYLQQELAKLVADVQRHAPNLVGVHDADDAMSNGPAAVEAWQAVKQLADTYSEIRSAQKTLFRNAYDDSTTTLTTDVYEATALYRFAIEHSPTWIERRTASAQQVSNAAGQDVLTYRDWLRSAKPSPAFNSNTTPVRHLIIVCTTMTPWIPTMQEFDEERSVSRYITATPTPHDVEPMARARDAYLAGKPAVIEWHGTEGTIHVNEWAKKRAAAARMETARDRAELGIN